MWGFYVLAEDSVMGGSAYALSRAFKRTTLRGNGTKTTTATSRTPIDSTNLAYLYLPARVGDVIDIDLYGTVQGSAAGVEIYVDFELDLPVSANIYTSSVHDRGCGNWWSPTGYPAPLHFSDEWVCTEAGLVGIRPVWWQAGGTGKLLNATSGAEDVPIIFTVRNLGPADDT